MKTLTFTLLKKIRPLLMVFFTLLVSDIVIGQITQITGSPQTATTTNTTLTITKPSGLAVGDIMIANIVQADNDGSNGGDLSNASRSGWTLIAGNQTGVTGSSGDEWWGTLLYRVATASDVSASNFAFSLDNSADDGAGGLVAFRGVDLTDGVTVTGAAGGPFDVDPGSTYNNVANDNTLNANAITTVTANAAVIMFGVVGDNVNISSWSTSNPGSLTEIYDEPFNADLDMGSGAAWALKPTTGSTGGGTASLSNNDWNASILIALRPGIVVPPTPLTAIGCDGQYYVSHGDGGTYSSNTLLKKLSFSGLVLTPNVFALSPGNIGFNAMGLNPIDGFIYAVRYPQSGQDAHLIKIGAGGGTNQLDLGAITAMSSNETAYSGCFDADGTFYFATTNGRLMKIVNPVTSLNATQITGSGFSSFADIAINPVDGQMYGVTTSTSGNFLYPINKTTGAISSGLGSGNMGGFFAALFFDELGNLFGYRADGPFYKINTATGALTAAGSGVAYTYADGCSCSSGRVFHTLASQPGVCPTPVNPNPTWNITVKVSNQSSGQKTGLTYTLEIPSDRFSFNQTEAAIATILFNAGLIPSNTPAFVTKSTVPPATGSVMNKLVVTNFQTGATASEISFQLQLIVATPGGPAESIPLQSVISGLPAELGSTDLSNDPNTDSPDDATIVDMCEGASLPVTLISFSGSLNNNTTSLNWVAENQVNFAYYDIERSTNSTDFTSIGTKALQGTEKSRENYQYNDNLAGVNGSVFFYRLKMMDIDGAFKYSNVIMIRKDQQVITGINFSPNPLVSGETATVRFKANSAVSVDFKVMDMSGRIVLTQKNNVSEGTNSVCITNLDRLQPGMYVLQMNDGETLQITKFNIVR